jgi:DNA-nicking Smr family endonuclease
MARRRNTGNDAEDDAGLWQIVARSVRPLSARKTPKDTPRKPVSVKTRNEPPPLPADPRLKVSKGFDAATETRLKKGKMPLESRLDLHGMTENQAHAALHRFIRAAWGHGLRTVLVITGKGRVGGGTLRRLVPLWLEEGGLESVVLAAVPARPKDGGDGALYVRLRNPEKMKRR